MANSRAGTGEANASWRTKNNQFRFRIIYSESIIEPSLVSWASKISFKMSSDVLSGVESGCYSLQSSELATRWLNRVLCRNRFTMILLPLSPGSSNPARFSGQGISHIRALARRALCTVQRAEQGFQRRDATPSPNWAKKRSEFNGSKRLSSIRKKPLMHHAPRTKNHTP